MTLGGKHHYHQGHNHHGVHSHPNVPPTGTFAVSGLPGLGVPAPGERYMRRALFFLSWGLFFVFGSAIWMGIGYGSTLGIGIAGTVFFVIGIALLAVTGVNCWKARQQRNEVIVNQQAGRGATLVYGQPGAPPTVVQPQAPGARMAYGQPGMQPIIQPQPPETTSIVYGPGGEVSYQPGAPANFQHMAQPYQPTAPDPLQSPQVITIHPDPCADPLPPPAYEEAVNLKQAIPSSDEKDGST